MSQGARLRRLERSLGIKAPLTTKARIERLERQAAQLAAGRTDPNRLDVISATEGSYDMSRCGHEKVPNGWVCTVRGDQHGDHMDGAGHMWPNEAVLGAAQVRSQGLSVGAIVAGSKPTSTAVRDTSHVRTGIPSDAVVAWQRDKGLWLERAHSTLIAVSRERTEPFTTPEHVWPLLVCPHAYPDTECDRRPMALAVQRALKANAIVEVGATRLKDIYRTLDRHEFAMNKLVPLYRGVSSTV